MIPATMAATSPRRAALLVHAMPAADRDWLLASLVPHQRVEIELLLDELRVLEIPPDAALLRDIVDAPAAAGAPTAQARLAKITQAQVGQLGEMLRKEPPQLVATVLAAQAWPWKADVQAALGAHAAQARPRHAAALQQALCDAVLRQMEASLPVPVAPVQRWQKLGPIRFHRKRA